MAKHKETGIKGEQIARNFLENLGYNILFTNWRFEKKEVDIIATHNNLLIFVEVKTRTSFDFGYPEEAVDSKKQTFLKTAADEFLYLHPQHEQLRFDIISILLKGDAVKELKHIEDAFF